MKRLATTIILVMMSSSVYAKPVYLQCNLSSGTEASKFTVKLDEDTGKATHTYSNGTAYNAIGFYSPTTISYKVIHDLGVATLSITYEIDRTTLKFTATDVTTMSNSYKPMDTEVKKGSCDILNIKDRKI